MPEEDGVVLASDWSLGKLGPLSSQGRDSTCLRRPQQVKEEKGYKIKIPFLRHSLNNTTNIF